MLQLSITKASLSHKDGHVSYSPAGSAHQVGAHYTALEHWNSEPTLKRMSYLLGKSNSK